VSIEKYQIEPEELRYGRIKAIGGSRGSGLWQVYFKDGTFCHIESGYGVRTVAYCYGSLQNAIGKLIRYCTDDLGMMTCFEPIEDGVWRSKGRKRK
jgi:hypothetical protein